MESTVSRPSMASPHKGPLESARRGSIETCRQDGMPVTVQLVGAILDATVIRAGLVPAHLEEMNDVLEEASHWGSPGAYPPSLSCSSKHSLLCQSLSRCRSLTDPFLLCIFLHNHKYMPPFSNPLSFFTTPEFKLLSLHSGPAFSSKRRKSLALTLCIGSRPGSCDQRLHPSLPQYTYNQVLPGKPKRVRTPPASTRGPAPELRLSRSS